MNKLNPDPLLSVIVPTLNSQNTIRKCFESLLNQTFQDFEILTIDGVSVDDTLEIINSYNSQKIRVFSDRDMGIYHAMNKGIKLAKGTWLYFLGSDDHLLNEKTFENVFLNKEATEFDVIYGNVVAPGYGTIYNGKFTVEKLFETNICHQAIFLKKHVFEVTGLFDLKYKSCADWDHNLKWFKSNTLENIYIEDIIAVFSTGGFSTQHRDNIFMSDKTWSHIKFRKDRINFLDKLRIIRSELLKALKENRKYHALKVLFESPYLFY